MQSHAHDPNQQLKSQIKSFMTARETGLDPKNLAGLPALVENSKLAQACHLIAKAYQENCQYLLALEWLHRGIKCSNDNDRRLCLRRLANFPDGSGFRPYNDHAAEYLLEAWGLYTSDTGQTEVETELKALTKQSPASLSAHIALASIYFIRYVKDHNETYHKLSADHLLLLNRNFHKLTREQKEQYEHLLENIILTTQNKLNAKITPTKEEKKSTEKEITGPVRDKLEFLAVMAKIFVCDAYCNDYNDHSESLKHVFTYFPEVINLCNPKKTSRYNAPIYSRNTEQLLNAFQYNLNFSDKDKDDYRKAVYAFFNTEITDDDHYCTIGNEFKKLAEKAALSSKNLAKYFVAHAYILAGGAYLKRKTEREVYFKLVNNLYINAYDTLYKKYVDPKIAIDALCSLTEKIYELDDKKTIHHHAQTLLNLFASEIKTSNTTNLKKICNALIKLSSKQSLVDDELFWLGLINKITEPVNEIFVKLSKEPTALWKALGPITGTFTESEDKKAINTATNINKTAIALLELSKKYILATKFKNVHFLLYDKLADFHARQKETEAKDVVELRKLAFETNQAIVVEKSSSEAKLTTMQAKIQQEQLDTVKQKYIDSLISAGESYLSDALTKESSSASAYAQVFFTKATREFGDIRGLIGLAKVPRDNKKETIGYLENALVQIFEKNRTELLFETISLLISSLEPLAPAAQLRMEIETLISTRFKYNEKKEEKQISRAEPSSFYKALMEQVKIWLKQGDKCLLAENHLNSILLDVLSWPCKHDKELLILISNYSLQRKGATKDEISRQCHLVFTDQPDISLKEKLASIKKVVALDKRHDGPISQRLAELQVLNAEKDKASGLMTILGMSKNHKIDSVSQPYVDALQDWMKLFLTPDYMTFNYKELEKTFRAVINLANDDKNPFAIYAKKQILATLNRTEGVIGLAFSFLFTACESSALNFQGESSKQQGDDQLNLVNCILLRLQYAKISKHEKDILEYLLVMWEYEPLTNTLTTPALYSTRQTQCDTIIEREKIFQTINAVKAGTKTLQDLVEPAQSDNLCALNFIARQYEKTNLERAIYFYLKILILTTDAQTAVDRFQLTHDLVNSFRKNALQFVSQVCREKPLAIWGLQLVVNPMLNTLMKSSPPPHTDTILTAAFTQHLKNDIIANSISQNGIYIPAGKEGSKVNAENVSDIANRLSLAPASSKPVVRIPFESKSESKREVSAARLISTLFNQPGATVEGETLQLQRPAP